MLNLKNLCRSVTVLFVVVNFSSTSLPQQIGISEYQYLSPVPGSSMNSPETNIIIKYGAPFNAAGIGESNVLEVTGEKSGLHKGEIKLVENNKTLLFNSYQPFAEGENVEVKFLKSLSTSEGKVLPRLEFQFRISEKDINKIINRNPEEFFRKLNPELDIKNLSSVIEQSAPQYSVMDDSLPAGFPLLEIDSLDNPTPGYIFLTPFVFQPSFYNYLIIMDNYGTPVFYRKLLNQNFDFKKQPSGELTYFHSNTWKFYVLNDLYNIIDSISAKNGYPTDVHDLVFLDNQHYLLMGYDNQIVRMDTIVPGGNPNAIVTGLVIQELDENKNVVFQWRSFDHFQITDATYDIDLTDSIVDYVHANAIELDADGNLLVSCRHMDEVTKINRQTGNIIWRWGGEHCENNQFTFINDPIGFSHQHDIRKLSNGNYTLFDNGNLHSPPFSRAVEYQLDEANKLAFLVWSYMNDPATYSQAMGNVRRLENHNTIIGWGLSPNIPAICEVKADGSVVLYATMPDTLFSYRAFKYPWKTGWFDTNPASLIFGYVQQGDSLEKPLEIINNTNQQIEINDYHTRNSVYTISSALPITIPSFGTETISVKFRPTSEQDYFDDLHLRWNKENERIAQVVSLSGSSDPNSFYNNEGQLPDYFLSQNYPNPFNPVTRIQYALGNRQFVSIKVYDLLGNEIAALVNEEKPAGRYEINFNGSRLPSGVYFYQLSSGNYVQTRKMVLLK